jgi:hypothetical protein
VIPFEVPDRFLVGVAAGAVRRIGATLRDRATGRIVAHLQETGLLQGLAGAGGPAELAGLVLSVGRLASSVIANVQLEQVKRMLSGLQFLTRASLAAAAVGVGVSVAGFALVLRRLSRVVEGLRSGRSEAAAARLAAERVETLLGARDRGRLESLLHRGEEAWARSDAAAVWKELDGALDAEQRYWQALVGGAAGASVFHDPRFTLEQAAAAYEAALTLAAARVQTLLLLEELPAARGHARQFQRWHDELLFGLTPTDIAAARSSDPARRDGASEADARGRLLPLAKRFMDGAREIQLHVAGRAAMVEALIERGVRGRAYVEALRERTDEAVLVLPGP